MKQLLFIFAFCFALQAIAQDKITATFDYEVSYEIANKDTVNVAFDKSGRYVWSDYSKIADDYTFVLNKGNNEDIDVSINIIYDTQSNKIYINLFSDELSFFMKLDLLTMFRGRSGAIKESVELVVDATDEKTVLMNKEYPVYEVYPDNEANSKLKMVFDTSLPVQNNAVFRKLMDLMSDKQNTNNTVKLNFPKGLILYAAEKGNSLLKAIEVKKISKTITINNTLEIKE